MSAQADRSLRRAIAAISARLKKLAPSSDPADCLAEGKLQVALGAVKSAAEILGEDDL